MTSAALTGAARLEAASEELERAAEQVHGEVREELLEAAEELQEAADELREDDELDYDVDIDIDIHDDRHHHHHDRTWVGLQFGALVSPILSSGRTQPHWRMTRDQSRACINPLKPAFCSPLRGFDGRINLFTADGRRDRPRVNFFFRSGYTAGRVQFDPAEGRDDFVPGEATSLSFFSIPLFVGGDLFVIKDFPLRPYAGMGAGFDILRLRYQRTERRRIDDVSMRIGFELHGGLEARINNYVSLKAEVMQLWSARRKVANVPDFSNKGLSFIAGVSLAIPSGDD